MPVLELAGPESMSEATEAALSWEYSAVVVKSGMPHSDDMLDIHLTNTTYQTGEIQSYIDSATVAAYSGLPMDTIQNEANRWLYDVLSREDDSMLRWAVKHGSINSHVDFEEEQPFVVSVGTLGVASWMTQQATEETVRELVRTDKFVGFDEGPIDEFLQDRGDVVFIPGFDKVGLKPTIHRVDADEDRQAILYSFESLSNR